MQKDSAVCIAMCALLCAASLALAACAPEPRPPFPVRAEASGQFQPVPPLHLAGGQAVKAFIDPVTGELRDPSQVELVMSARGGSSLRALDPPYERWVETCDRGTAPAAVPEVAKSECSKAGDCSATYRCGLDH